MGDFAAMGEVAGVRECRDDAAFGSAGGVPAAVVEVEVRVDDDVDFFGADLGGLEGLGELFLYAVDGF